jgi:hypothetical protein
MRRRAEIYIPSVHASHPDGGTGTGDHRVSMPDLLVDY